MTLTGIEFSKLRKVLSSYKIELAIYIYMLILSGAKDVLILGWYTFLVFCNFLYPFSKCPKSYWKELSSSFDLSLYSNFKTIIIRYPVQRSNGWWTYTYITINLYVWSESGSLLFIYFYIKWSHTIEFILIELSKQFTNDKEIFDFFIIWYTYYYIYFITIQSSFSNTVQ